MKKILLIVAFICLSFQSVAAKENVQWMVLNWPPWMILEGPDQGEGPFDKIQSTIIASLPEYNHQQQVMNWARFWYEAEEGNNICDVFSLKSLKRRDIVYYSDPLLMVLPNAIIMTRKNGEKLGSPESYSLVQLLQDGRFKGVVEESRSFTQDLDLLLKEYEPESNLSRSAGKAESFIKMVAAGRIDYTLEYPNVIRYQEKNFTDNLEPLISIPIAEVAPFSYVYLTCTKNEWGKKIVDNWNVVLRRLKPTKEYRHISEIGLNGENELDIIRRNYDSFIDAR